MNTLIGERRGRGRPRSNGNGNEESRPKREVKPLRSPLYKLRLANLKRLIRMRYGGSQASCARALGKSHNYLWQILNAYRAIGEDTARFIEEKLGLGDGTLDKKAGDAFERNTTLTAQLGDGYAAQIIMVPVISVRDSLGSEKVRRKAMEKAQQYVPCHNGCTEDAYAIIVDFTSMESRLRRGDTAIIEPKDRVLVDDKTYWLLVKETGKPVIRVCVKLDTGTFKFTVPSDNPQAATTRPLSVEEVEVLGRVRYMTREI